MSILIDSNLSLTNKVFLLKKYMKILYNLFYSLLYNIISSCLLLEIVIKVKTVYIL